MEAVNESYLMKEGKQKISDTPEICPQKNRTASEDYVGGQTFIGITENNAFSKDQSELSIGQSKFRTPYPSQCELAVIL